ncbi:MAG TPA: RidA family protein [Alphaproteobacteria bacterium]|nr:RidA family protein [Alphaproteobacteria bacterium]
MSGCGPSDAEMNLIGSDDVAAQTRQVLANRRRILVAAGASFADILKVTPCLTDGSDCGKIEAIAGMPW